MTDEPALLGGWLHLPFSAIGGEEECSLLRRRLTHSSPGYAGFPGKTVRLYDDGKPGYLGVPRAWGMREFAHVPAVDLRTDGYPIAPPWRPDPNHPRVLEPAKQAKFMADMLAEPREDFLAQAGTGTGKTTCALNTAAERGRTTMIIVHMEALMQQWLREIQDKLGVPRDKIGIIQGPKCDYQGKWFCIGILNSLAQKTYDDAFYTYFGTVILDEAHKVACEFFAPALPRFYARRRLLLTATPKRKDGSDRVFFYHGGPIAVTSTARTLPMEVRVLRHHNPPPAKLADKRAVLNALMDDPIRNARIVRCILRFHELGRTALIVSAEIVHVQMLMSMAAQVGVPVEVMGQLTAETQKIKRVRMPGGLVVEKRVGTKQRPAVLDGIKARAQIIFSTYNMMDAGLDIPRLDAGLDATPSPEAEQLIGRIRRPMPGKAEPLWITVRDTGHEQCERWFKSRCRDYRATEARVVDHGTQAGGIDRRAA